MTSLWVTPAGSADGAIVHQARVGLQLSGTGRASPRMGVHRRRHGREPRRVTCKPENMGLEWNSPVRDRAGIGRHPRGVEGGRNRVARDPRALAADRNSLAPDAWARHP